MEMADAIAITKADGDNLNPSKIAVNEYKRGLHLFPSKKNKWIPRVLTCSAYENKGITEIWETIASFINHCITNNHYEENRKKQAQFWLHESIQEQLGSHFYKHPKIKAKLNDIEKAVVNGDLSPFVAAQQLLNLFHTS